MAGEYESLDFESGFPIMTDPVLDDIFADVRAYQKELDYTPNASHQELEAIVEALNENWPLYDEPVGVSGLVTSARLEFETDDDGHVEIVPAYMPDASKLEEVTFVANDQVFMSRGFAIDITPWPELVGGYDIGQRAVIKLLFERHVQLHVNDTDSRLITIPCTADLDKVSLESGYESTESAELKSREYFAEAVAATDQCINHTMSVSERLLALKTVSLTYADYITGYEQAALQHYINEIVNLESESMPYMIQLKKNAVLFDTDDNQMDILDIVNGGSLLVQPTGIRLYTKLDTKPLKKGVKVAVYPGVFDARLQLCIIAREQSDDSPVLELRLRDIKNIKNIRELCYPDI